MAGMLASRLLTLRNSPGLSRLPPYLSALLIGVGLAWLLVLPLDAYSRQTYVSENALLPAQVHTYFGGSEHNIFRAYRQEVYRLGERSDPERIAALHEILRQNGLKAALQPYRYRVAGEDMAGTNVYGVLQGPRADATEAVVLMAAWRTVDGAINYSGVALVLTLARYFKRWSIWSKDIIVLIPADSAYASAAWVSAYHSTAPVITPGANVSALPIKAGALQAAVALDYPAGPWGHRFAALDLLYDGINGALPNLDLLNTAVAIASGQMGIACTLHGLALHSDSYAERLTTMARGVLAQAAGHATGPHSAFTPYRVDAITLRASGDGWHDEMTLGRTTESLFRSVNNLLEHLHQSFAFYLLMNANRFVSIGTYLPSAMLLAGSFTVTALGLWVQSGRRGVASATPQDNKREQPDSAPIKSGRDTALVAQVALEPAERTLLLPVFVLLLVHATGSLPLYALTHCRIANLPPALVLTTSATLILPPTLSLLLPLAPLHATAHHFQTLQSLSLLLLAASLSTLATLNFSLALLVALLAAPLAAVRPLPRHHVARAVAAAVAYAGCAPPVLGYGALWVLGRGVGGTLVEVARGWAVQGVWTAAVVWGVWWPAWLVGGVVLLSGLTAGEGTRG